MDPNIASSERKISLFRSEENLKMENQSLGEDGLNLVLESKEEQIPRTRLIKKSVLPEATTGNYDLAGLNRNKGPMVKFDRPKLSIDQGLSRPDLFSPRTEGEIMLSGPKAIVNSNGSEEEMGVGFFTDLNNKGTHVYFC
jgi:hypothetical protein